jgi:hypothetical protein
LSEDQEERIEIDIDNNNGDFDESSDIAEPLEIIREEVVEVVENPDTETSPLSSMGDQQEEEEDQKNKIRTDNSNRYTGDIYEQFSRYGSIITISSKTVARNYKITKAQED